MVEFLHIEHTGASGTAHGPDMSLTQSSPQIGHSGTPRNDHKYLSNAPEEKTAQQRCYCFWRGD